MKEQDRTIRLAAVQFRGSSDREANIRQAQVYIERAAEQGADMICLHEMLNTDYFCPDGNPEFAAKTEPIPGLTTEWLAEFAKRYGVHIVAGIAEHAASDRVFYNSAIALNAEGELIAHYRKLHRSGSEERCFVKGELTEPVFIGPRGIRCGIMVCYDRHFPELSRRLAKAGAELILIPTTTAVESWTQPVWRSELRAIASTNRVYVAAANRVGKDEQSAVSLTYFGQSMIVSPDGTVLSEASDCREELISADIDPDEAQRWQRKEPGLAASELQQLQRIYAGAADARIGNSDWKEAEIRVQGGMSIIVGEEQLDPAEYAYGQAVVLQSGFAFARLTERQAHRPEYWRALARNGTALIIAECEGHVEDTFLAEMQYLSVSSPCYVLVASKDPADTVIWIQPNGSSSAGTVNRLIREELDKFQQRTGVVRHRRDDLLDPLFEH